MRKLLGNKKVRFLLIAVATVLAVAAGVLYASGPKPVEAFAVSEQELIETFSEDGAVRAQSREVVSTGIPGRLAAVYVGEGQQVKKGDKLFAIDSSDLLAEQSLLLAEKESILASWEQARDQVELQIAAIEAQRAGVRSADISGLLGSQIALLDNSLNPLMPDSVAFAFEQMLSMTQTRMRYIDAQIARASDQTPAEVQAIEGQLEAARSQNASIKNQQSQYDEQKQAQIAELAAKRDAAADAATQQSYQDMIDQLRGGGVDSSYSSMQDVVESQITRLERDLRNAKNAVPQTVDALTTQRLALHSEQQTLTEQYSQYRQSAKSQILALTAQQEQSAAALSAERDVRGKLNLQIDLLRESAQQNSGTAKYYAAQLTRVEASLADSARRLALAEVTAPIDGIVGAIGIMQGEYLPAGAKLTEVSDPGTLLVECMLLTDDADSVSTGEPVAIVWERRSGDAQYEGTLKEISSVAVGSISSVGLSEQRVKLLIEPGFSGSDTYPKDGYQVRVRFTTAKQTALAVPRSAIVKTDSGDAVYVMREGKAHLAHITTGMEAGDSVAVLGGLSPRDTVVRDPAGAGIGEGDNVKAQN